MKQWCDHLRLHPFKTSSTRLGQFSPIHKDAASMVEAISFFLAASCGMSMPQVYPDGFGNRLTHEEQSVESDLAGQTPKANFAGRSPKAVLLSEPHDGPRPLIFESKKSLIDSNPIHVQSKG